jgi:hypothetical protein
MLYDDNMLQSLAQTDGSEHALRHINRHSDLCATCLKHFIACVAPNPKGKSLYQEILKPKV